MWKSLILILWTALLPTGSPALRAQSAPPPLPQFWLQPALPARLGGRLLALGGEYRYGLRETARYTLAAAFSTEGGGWAVSAGRWGTSRYAEMNLSLSYGRPLGRAIWAGLRVGGVREGGAGFLRVGGGLLVHPAEGVILSLHATGTAASWRKGAGVGPPDRLQVAYGIWWVPSAELSLGAGLRAGEDGAPEAEGGAVYLLHPRVRLRGWMGSSGTVYGGAGLRFGSWWVEPGAAVHPVLGPSPQLLLLLFIPRS